MARDVRRNGWQKELPGFTLIEILVVVAIIALLISVLLPSLARAREQARAAACAANLSQLARAENLYSTSNQEWIPGSPVTTGFSIAANEPPLYNPFLPNFNRYTIMSNDYATPLRAAMYGTTTFPRPATPAQAMGAWTRLWSLSGDDVFNCPSNKYVFPAISKYADFSKLGAIKSTSYLTMTEIVRAGQDFYDNFKKLGYKGSASSTNYKNLATQSTWDVATPKSYMPRHSKLKTESLKVFLADGTRFYDPLATPAAFDFMPDSMNTTKGHFSGSPPAFNAIGGPEYNNGRDRSYRHMGNSQISAAFFDGHVEAMKVDFRGKPAGATGYAGRAVDPKYYFPSGSVVNTPSALHKQLPQGTILP